MRDQKKERIKMRRVNKSREHTKGSSGLCVHGATMSGPFLLWQMLLQNVLRDNKR